MKNPSLRFLARVYFAVTLFSFGALRPAIGARAGGSRRRPRFNGTRRPHVLRALAAEIPPESVPGFSTRSRSKSPKNPETCTLYPFGFRLAADSRALLAALLRASLAGRRAPRSPCPPPGAFASAASCFEL